MKIPSPVSRKKARIEIIPLIDIVFFLLGTFVMVSLSMVQNKGVHVNLPVAKSAQTQDQRPVITISIQEDGQILWEKTPVSLDQLTERLKNLKSIDPDPKLMINGDKKSYFESAISVLDAARRLGIHKVSIRTK
jgi:biopolymer transport protein ExbD